MNSGRKKALGKGLDAILGPLKVPSEGLSSKGLGQDEKGEDEGKILQLDPNKIMPNKYQTRKNFDEDSLKSLAESIKKYGLQEPIVVRKKEDTYELVCGERRLRASILAGVTQIPAICKNISDDEALLIGLIENIQREDLNPIEEAEAYITIINKYNWTQEQLAEAIGKDRSTVANTIRLINLPDEIKELLISRQISSGHARCLLSLPTKEAIIKLANEIVSKELSVRQTEEIVNRINEKTKKRRISQPNVKDPYIRKVEQTLSRQLGTKVILKPQSTEKGKIEIEYYSNEDLNRILEILGYSEI
ncbi:MAG: ParB/RepB/Spo0J family partition protein [Candidatus Hydrogenedentes bacterium]|nr:ParB/RepB/Spo0J family partition protein [Candidatus Hydrogenedentota bacterium]